MENDNENERLNEDNKKNIKTEKKERVVNEVLEWIFCIVIAVVLAFTTVRQESMYPTLKNDRRLWLDGTLRAFNRRI